MKRMSDKLYDQLFPLACEHLGGKWTPRIMQELDRARQSELELAAMVANYQRKGSTHEDQSSGVVQHQGEDAPGS